MKDTILKVPAEKAALIGWKPRSVETKKRIISQKVNGLCKFFRYDGGRPYCKACAGELADSNDNETERHCKHPENCTLYKIPGDEWRR
jgi:hypothetical protein